MVIQQAHITPSFFPGLLLSLATDHLCLLQNKNSHSAAIWPFPRPAPLSQYNHQPGHKTDELFLFTHPFALFAWFPWLTWNPSHTLGKGYIHGELATILMALIFSNRKHRILVKVYRYKGLCRAVISILTHEEFLDDLTTIPLIGNLHP